MTTWPKTRTVVGGVLFGIEFGGFYAIMLVAMTFNIGLFLAVVMGASLGYVLFESPTLAPGVKKQEGMAGCCG